MRIPGLVPLPRSVTALDGAPVRLDATTVVTGPSEAAALAASVLAAGTGLAPAVRRGEQVSTAAVRLVLDGRGGPESYRLRADGGAVVVTAADEAGLLHGVHTLVQLLRPAPRAGTWELPAIDVDDAPRFRHRGVMLDVARHFFDVATVKTLVDRASSLKLNVLHLHLSDDQGWRIRLPSRPLLTERASSTAVGGDPGGFYTEDDYREIVAYAAARHMTVVPEIDLPGHTHAVGLAYPAIAADPVIDETVREAATAHGGGLPATGEPYTGVAVGFSSLRPRDEETYRFVADVVEDLAAMTPGPYLHIGGDEALGTDPADFAAFMARTTAIVAAAGKTPIAWHEAGAADLAAGTVGQYWGFVVPTDGRDESARAFVRGGGGGGIVLSPADAVYLDMQDGEAADIGLTWANGPTSVERSRSWDPAEVIPGIGDDAILGVEAALWTETVRTPADIDLLAFPRLASAAEAAWSPRTGPGGAWASFRERVGALGPLWTRLGIGFRRSREIPWEDA